MISKQQLEYQFERDGAQYFAGAFNPSEWYNLLSVLPKDKAGVRLFGLEGLDALVGQQSMANSIASRLAGKQVHPVRAVFFNKTATNNWPLGWHQDRTIAVKSKVKIAGFCPWSIKAGVHHVEPPYDVISNMVTLRLHFDDVDIHNAPLKFIPGSQLLGKIETTSYSEVTLNSVIGFSEAKAGDIWAYQTSILHASDAAAKPKQRRVVQIDYSFDSLPEPLEWAGVT